LLRHCHTLYLLTFGVVDPAQSRIPALSMMLGRSFVPNALLVVERCFVRIVLWFRSGHMHRHSKGILGTPAAIQALSNYLPRRYPQFPRQRWAIVGLAFNDYRLRSHVSP
jgi:hypothetical protein